MQPTFSILEVVPHASIMSLLDAVESYGEDELTAIVTISENSLFLEERGVPSWVGIEYMAQAIAACDGVQRRLKGGEPKVGFLVGARKYACNCSYFPLGAVLKVKVGLEFRADNGLGVFNCTIFSDEGIAADTRLNVFLPADLTSFLETGLPE